MADECVTKWYAVKSQREFEAERCLGTLCDEVYLPKETVKIAMTGGRSTHRIRPVIPRLLFIRTTESHALTLEKESRLPEKRIVPFWIYRYQAGGNIQPISEREMSLVKLLTANDTSRCEVYHKADFKKGDHVRITAGMFEGYEGYVRRIGNNKHVVVEIEGICSLALPFIHPDLLEHIS